MRVSLRKIYERGNAGGKTQQEGADVSRYLATPRFCARHPALALSIIFCCVRLSSWSDCDFVQIVILLILLALVSYCLAVC